MRSEPFLDSILRDLVLFVPFNQPVVGLKVIELELVAIQPQKYGGARYCCALVPVEEWVVLRKTFE